MSSTERITKHNVHPNEHIVQSQLPFRRKITYRDDIDNIHRQKKKEFALEDFDDDDYSHSIDNTTYNEDEEYYGENFWEKISNHPSIPKVAQCGIDYEAIVYKMVMGPFINPRFDDKISVRKGSVHTKHYYEHHSDYYLSIFRGEFLRIFSVEGEYVRDCSKQEEIHFVQSVESYLSCSGFNITISELLDILHDINLKCKDATSNALNFLWIDEATRQDTTVDEHCFDAIFGSKNTSSPISSFLQDLYYGKHTEQYCKCSKKLVSVPECLYLHYGDATKTTDYNNNDEMLELPGSLVKTLACVGCNSQADFCQEELNSLDGCLPPMASFEDENVDLLISQCKSVIHKCSQKSILFNVAPPNLGDDDSLPYECHGKLSSSEGSEDVIERYNRLNAVCPHVGVYMPPRSFSSGGGSTKASTSSSVSSDEQLHSKDDGSSNVGDVLYNITSGGTSGEHNGGEKDVMASHTKNHNDLSMNNEEAGFVMVIIAIIIGIAAYALVRSRKNKTEESFQREENKRSIIIVDGVIHARRDDDDDIPYSHDRIVI